MNESATGLPQLPWHPWTGCSPVSPSCLNCYAMPEDGDQIRKTARGPIWNGKLVFNEPQISVPSSTKGPHIFQVCPHGDAFHENAPDEWLDRVFDIMEREQRHVLALVTKRSERMLDYMLARYVKQPAPANILLGVLVERQYEANTRIANLVRAPASSKYLIFYCLMGPVDIFSIPDVEPYQLATMRAVQIASDGWARESVEEAWSDKVAEDFAKLGITATRQSLQTDIATRGW